jgi:hypothetical protein
MVKGWVMLPLVVGEFAQQHLLGHLEDVAAGVVE